MMSAGTILCALPPLCFSGKPNDDMAAELLRSYVPALRIIERRIRKDVAADEERTRYARLCRQIEDVALSRAVPAARENDFRTALSRGEFPSIRIGPGYVDFLARLHTTGTSIGVTHDARLGATVFSPDELQKHLARFRSLTSKPEWEHEPSVQHRSWFIGKRLIPHGCGLVEVADTFGISNDDPPMDVRTFWDRVRAWFRRFGAPSQVSRPLSATQGTSWTSSVNTDWKQYEAVPQGNYMHSRLRAQIEQALEGGPPINLGNQRHALLTEELVRHLHTGSRPPTTVGMMYESGQPTRSIRLRCVGRLPDGWTATRTLHVGLISMRHLPIDQYIDINWYRNVDVPSQEGLSGADEACYRVSLAQFARLADIYRGHRLRLYVYHSGFLPAVVAFYRALTERLSRREHSRGSLQVIPMLEPRSDGTYHQGKPWPG